MSKNIIIDPKDLSKVFDRLTDEALKHVVQPTSTQQDNAITLMWRTLRHLQDGMFSYLPEGERNDADALCATYMTLGLVIGGDKDLLVQVLKESGARLKHISDGEGGDEE